jgi:MSHA pilin protein MshC
VIATAHDRRSCFVDSSSRGGSRSAFVCAASRSSHTVRRAARARGFTLIELVAVIIIAAVLAVSFIPKGSNQASLTLTARAKQLASDIRYAQSLSMTNGQRYCVTLTPSSPYSGYSLTTAASNCITTTAHPGNLSQPVPVCSSGTCMTAPALPNGYLQFDGLGQPYTTATALLAANAVITLTDNGSTQTVTVVPTTGRVTVP